MLGLPDVITFQYDYQAAKLRVIRHLQKKYVRQDALAADTSHESIANGIENVTATDAGTPTLGSGGDAASLSEPSTSSVTTNTTSAAPSEIHSGDMAPAADSAAPTPTTSLPPAAMDSARPRIVIAPKRLALPGCEAAPGLLAFIWLSKYGDNLPLYRLETITQYYGINFARSTTCDWMMELGEVLQPL